MQWKFKNFVISFTLQDESWIDFASKRGSVFDTIFFFFYFYHEHVILASAISTASEFQSCCQFCHQQLNVRNFMGNCKHFLFIILLYWQLEAWIWENESLSWFTFNSCFHITQQHVMDTPDKNHQYLTPFLKYKERAVVVAN